ncbi:putative RNA recognition motif domain, nucleotide-binding alpha-beta plait domain superfamily [Helianthus debilis subsp. tardiflorus]
MGGIGMEADDDSWETQNRRNRGRPGSGVSKSEITKFFVTNIPTGCRPWDLANAFRIYGEIAGAFIAKKKDKEGKIFGFVSFKGVRDVEDLTRNISKVKLGGNNLSINVALFAKENVNLKPYAGSGGGLGGRGKNFENRKEFPGNKPQVKDFSSVKKGVSFLDILTNKSHVEGDEDVVTVDPSTFSMSCFIGRAAIGRAVGFKELRFLRTSLSLAGYGEASIQYIGGLSVLISFSGGKRLTVCCMIRMSGAGFSRLLTHGLGSPCRMRGLHGLTFSVKYGKVIHASQTMESDGDISYDRVGILIDSGNRINGVLSLRWQDKKYRVWVVEETVPWIPDFLESKVDSGGFSSEEGGDGSVPVCSAPMDIPVNVEKVGQEDEESTPDIEKTEGVHGDVKSAGLHGEFNYAAHAFSREQRPFIGSSQSLKNGKLSGVNDGNKSFSESWVNLVGQSSPRPKKGEGGRISFPLRIMKRFWTRSRLWPKGARLMLFPRLRIIR